MTEDKNPRILSKSNILVGGGILITSIIVSIGYIYYKKYTHEHSIDEHSIDEHSIDEHSIDEH